MAVPILATKLYIPQRRPNVVLRPRLIERLNAGLLSGRKLTLVSAPAGFGKTTLVGEWISRFSASLEVTPAGAEAESKIHVAWLSLDKGDNDPVRFLAYFVAALQTITPDLGSGVLAALQTPQPPPLDTLLTALLNEIVTIPNDLVLVLDDYHAIEAESVNQALTFLIEYLPSQLHLVVATREDPPLSLARLRTRGQLIEVRAAELRFTPAEAAEFLNRAMGLDLTVEEISALEAHTEGWIAGLQLAALALQGTVHGHQDAAGFIRSFTGSHRFVMDYLLEEVLHQQPASVQTFLLRTSLLDRLCGPLCDAVLSDPAISGQETLEYLERANLFVVPLDDERRWYRYHHLFADLLRQRLRRGEGADVTEYHIRASEWYEERDLLFEAFHHAAAAHDIERAERLIQGPEMPLHFRGAVTTILDWLGSLPPVVLDARPSLWATYASLSLVAGQTTGVEEKLRAAESAMAETAGDDETRNLAGQIAATRATLALTRYDAERVIAQARRALEYLHPKNLAFRFTAVWALAFAHYLRGDRAAAGRAYTEAIAISQVSGDVFSTILASSGLGSLQEADNQLHLAAETYRHILDLHGEHPQPNACEAYLGLARIYYQWNDLDRAEEYGQQSLRLAQQYESVIDRFIISEIFLARLKLARGDVGGAIATLVDAEQMVRRRNFVQRLPEVAAARVLALLQQGRHAAAADLAQQHDLPLSRARVHLARGEPEAALAVLVPWRRHVEARGWQDEVLKAMVLQAVALDAHGEVDAALNVLGEALAMAEPGGFVRIFVDTGPPMARLLCEALPRGIVPEYVRDLLAAFPDLTAAPATPPEVQGPASEMVEALSERELEVLRLVAQGLSNREIGERLFIALSTVKTHNRNIYGKLQVNRRTEAVARARELGLL